MHSSLPPERLSRLEAVVARQQACIDYLEAAVAERDRRIVSLQSQLEQAKARQAEQQAHIEQLQKQLAERERTVAELQQKLRRNSRNSSRPPSTDPPGTPRRREPPSGRARGGQPGHPRHEREWVPPDKLSRVRDLFPDCCRKCRRPLLPKEDPEPLRHQVVELPAIVGEVTEYRRHRVSCDCGQVNVASLPPEAEYCFGPRLTATEAMLTGCYRLSKRNAQQLLEDLMHVKLSLGQVSDSEGQVSEAVADPVAQARAYVEQQGHAYVDETSWREGLKPNWLWVAVTLGVTVFLIAKHRSYEAAKALLGQFVGVVVSDRAKAYLPFERRQVDWAHLLRDFEAMVERGGSCAQVGQKLLDAGQALFRYWHKIRDGTYTQEHYRARMALLRREVRQALEEGVERAGPQTAATCRELLELEPFLWTFVAHPELEPTNNAAERALRGAVLWRKGSFGTQSERGSRFVERMLTVVTSLRQQQRNVLEYLTEAVRCYRMGLCTPMLLPGANAAT